MTVYRILTLHSSKSCIEISVKCEGFSKHSIGSSEVKSPTHEIVNVEKHSAALNDNESLCTITLKQLNCYHTSSLGGFLFDSFP
jgi:hypothetical protein